MKFVIILCVVLVAVLVYLKFRSSSRPKLQTIGAEASAPLSSRQFVILNDNDEWLYCDTRRLSCEFTCDKSRISIFTLTDKGNIVLYDDVLVYELGIDDDHRLVIDKPVDCRFSLDNRRVILEYTTTKERYILSDTMSFEEYRNASAIGNGATSSHVRVEYVNNPCSFN